jgi:peptide chain release factor 2
MAKPGFWDNADSARRTVEEVKALKRWTQPYQDVRRRVDHARELADLLEHESDAEIEKELEVESGELSTEVERLVLQAMLQGPEDQLDALITIHPGAGGTESQDWAEMLMRMYLRWAERRGYRTEVLDISPGEETGVKSAVIAVEGDYASGYLKSEHGVHRLVRLSPFDADHARHTSFALVEVLPEAEKDTDIKIGPDEVKMETFRSSGPGGQHRQKTSTAVRLTHLPTGITNSIQSQRSQFQNREIAFRILHSRLLERELGRRHEEMERLKGKYVSAEFGNQIRSYVLHPYKMVKDHRTGMETGNAPAVLEGELDEFIEAYLRSLVAAP